MQLVPGVCALPGHIPVLPIGQSVEVDAATSWLLISSGNERLQLIVQGGVIPLWVFLPCGLMRAEVLKM